MQPTVSLVIVNADRRDELTVVLKSLEYQRYPAFEVIVVSDIATDARPESPLPIHWIHFTERNISAARNLGIAAARGEVVAFCDDDAVPEFSWLEHLVPAFADPAVGAAGGFVRGRNGVSFQWRAMGFDRTGADHPLALDGNAPQVFAPDAARFVKTVGTNSAFRRAALADIGGFDTAFRFFLDETDVNLRLSAAGWSTAIVPLAQVHHGFAASALRTADRVPTSLYEIGASLAHFLGKHAPADSHEARRASFRAEQAERLARHRSSGALEAAAEVRLLEELEQGFTDGAARTASGGLPKLAERSFTPVPARPGGAARRRLFAGGLLHTGAALRAARQAALEGDEVTLLLPEATPRPLRVSFGADGVFHHRFGLAGRVARDAGRVYGTPRARIAAETDRIAPLRGPFAPLDRG
ncbi:glycosyltransferase family 2 protein [Oceanibium sediminis]|uniref:glycosyltransferase family 2 protein n=1 Tax=Oceanibium sediminis TaxID=2026339 RepID=UPI000DD2BFFE|nr:glycosyltransferase [Oceanibium sediminis]